jgi:hypothetical protein
MDLQLSACAESKELCFQLIISRFEERAFYVSRERDAIYGAECAGKIRGRSGHPAICDMTRTTSEPKPVQPNIGAFILLIYII